MSEENTIPEAPAELPTAGAVETPNAPAADVAAPLVQEVSPTAESAVSNGPVEASAPAVLSVAVDPAGELVVDANVRAALVHVLDGFNNFSLALGFQRIADLLAK